MAWNDEAGEPIFLAIKAGNIDRFVELLTQNPDNLRLDESGICPWIEDAAHFGRVDFLKLLQEKYGVDVVIEPCTTEHGRNTALYDAASNGQLEAVRWLLDHGATVNREYDGELHCSSLYSAAASGYLDVVKLLVERGAYLDTGNNYGINTITMADMNGQLEVTKYLRSIGAKHMCEITPPDHETAHKLILKSLTKSRGPLADWRLEIPGDPLVKIHTIPAGKKWDTRTLFTLGLGDKNLPWEKLRLYQFQELRLPLSADWPFDEAALADPEWNWPVEWLKRLVIQLRAGTYWPEEPILLMNGDPPQPLAPTTQQCGWLCLRSFAGDGVYVTRDHHRCIGWYDLYSLYAEEAAFVREHGHDKLVVRFDKAGVPLYVDPQRENVAI